MALGFIPDDWKSYTFCVKKTLTIAIVNNKVGTNAITQYFCTPCNKRSTLDKKYKTYYPKIVIGSIANGGNILGL